MNKIRKIFCWMYLSHFSLSGYCQQTGIQFEQHLTWKQILQKAKKENKYIFLDCYATWCSPCREMEQQVYSKDTVGQKINDKFLSVKVQVDSTQNDNQEIRGWYADSHKLSQGYKVKSLPTFLFFSPDGKIVHRGVGFMLPSDFVLLAEHALNKDRQYYTLLAKFRQGKYLDSNSLIYLVRITNDMGDGALAEEMANKYIESLDEKSLYKQKNIELMIEFTKKSSERGFDVFRYHADQVFKSDSIMEAKYSKAIVEKIIYSEDMQPFSKSKNGKPDWEKIKKNISKYGDLGTAAYIVFRPGMVFKSVIIPALDSGTNWDSIILLIKKQQLGVGEVNAVAPLFGYYENELRDKKSNNYTDLFSVSQYYIKTYPELTKSMQLNEMAWQSFLYGHDTSQWNEAINWSKKAVDSAGTDNPNLPDYMDTYANLLYALGEDKQAIIWEQKASALRKDDVTISKTLEKMEKGEKIPREQ